MLARPSRPVSRLVFRLAPVALGLLLLAACGDGDATGPDGPDGNRAQPARVRVTPDEATLDFLGDTVRLSAAVLDPADQPLDRPVTWASSAPEVASVSAEGLVTARAPGTARIAAASGDAEGFADLLVRQLPRTLHLVSGDGQEAPVGALLPSPLVVEVRDEGGSPTPGAALSWYLSAGAGQVVGASERTDAEGRGEARWRMGAGTGAHTLRVVMTGPSLPGKLPHTDAAAFTAVALEDAGAASDTVRVLAVEPTVLVEGDSARILGAGLGSDPGELSVLVDGVAAPVVSVSDSVARITVPRAACRPPREAVLAVSRGTTADTAPVEVTPGALLSPGAGEGFLAPSGCLHLEGGGGERAYLIGIQSTAGSAATLTPGELRSEAGGSVGSAVAAGVGGTGEAPGRLSVVAAGKGRGAAGPASSRVGGRVPALPSRWVRHRAAEAALRDEEARELAALGGLASVRAAAVRWRGAEGSAPGAPASQGAAAAPAAVPAVGDTLTLGVGTGCTDRETVEAVARHVGEETIWLEDTANPAGGFSRDDYRALDARYAASVEGTLAAWFGRDRDVDGNGRLLVLVTRAVNEDRNLLGYVWSGDLYPAGLCPGSNEAEIFYGIAPDPQGRQGTRLPASAALAEYPALMAHEATHVIQRSEQLFGQAGERERWETEGGATLAEQLVGHAVSGLGSGQDLGWAEVDRWRDWYLRWVVDLALYQGLLNGRRVDGAPEECTWLGDEEAGNTGPCRAGRAVYGVPATLLRWVLDRHGAEHPEGEEGLMRAITASPATGYAALEEATGRNIRELLAGFHAALWMDGRWGDALPSWDLLDIFDNLSAQASLLPHASGTPEPTLSVRVRGGSTALLEWTPGAHEPTSLRLTGLGGAPLPSWMAVWVVRLR